MYQYAEQLTKVAIESGLDACLIAPLDALESSPLPKEAKVGYVTDRESTLRLTREQANAVAGMIDKLEIDLVVFTSPCGPAYQIMRRLGATIQFDVVVHDVLFHSTHSIKKKIIYPMLRLLHDIPLFKNARRVWLLSNNSLFQFKEKYPRWGAKTLLFPLGAHAPECGRKRPEELRDIKRYLLFFGRLDAQKGIDRLLRSYSAARLDSLALVIAGNGILTDEEARLVESEDSVCLIKRFIENDEMMWLMENCMAVVLPYRDATQSGVLPLAYYCAKPVIASNIDGLREFVEDGVTGYLVDDETGLTERIRTLAANQSLLERMGTAARSYSQNELNWKRNFTKVLEA